MKEKKEIDVKSNPLYIISSQIDEFILTIESLLRSID